jgi:proto-oncogene tyrosine-protein kinase ROS
MYLNSLDHQIYCNIGCNQALYLYTNKSRSEIGSPSAPFLAGDTLRNDSVVLQWKTSSHHNVSYLIQFRYSQLGTDWIFYRPERPLRTDQVLVQNLQPYTAYRFRVLWLLEDVANVPQSSRYSRNFEQLRSLATPTSSKAKQLLSSKAANRPTLDRTLFDSDRLKPIYSDESVEIRTLPYGVPSVPPRMIGCLALGPGRLLISYESPRFPNDRLIGFALTASPVEQAPNQVEAADQLHRDLKAPIDDLPTQHYTLAGLQSNRTYTIRLGAINRFGNGPFAQLNCSTPIDPTQITSIKANPNSSDSSTSIVDQQEPLLVFATPKTIALKRTSLPLEPVSTLLRLDDFTQNDNFTAIAVHVQRGLVFTADTSGSIRRLQLQTEVARKIINKQQLLIGWHPLSESAQVRVLDMTVDWLNDRLYVLRQVRWPSGYTSRQFHADNQADPAPLNHVMNSLHSYQMYSEQIELLRCNFDGHDLRTLLRFDYGELPVNMQIDPINGFLFWSAINNYHHLPHLQSQQFNSWWMEEPWSPTDPADSPSGSPSKPTISSSLYRIDLTLLNANHSLSSAVAQSIVKIASPQAAAFTISPNEMRLLYVHPQSNQSAIVRSITLDGSDPIDVRDDRVERSLFQPRMRNLALFNQLLFWTLGNETFREHFHSGRYFHNTIFVDQRLQPMLALRLVHPSLQPYPRPVSQVVALQALLLRTDAKIRWQAPAPLFGAGQAAFSRWKYEICIGELNTHFSIGNGKRAAFTVESNEPKSNRNQSTDYQLTDLSESNFWPSDELSQLRKRICFELTDTFCALGQLKANTSYVFRVRPLSSAGPGPWSNGFYGSTLPELPHINFKQRNWTTTAFGGNKLTAADSLFLATEIGLIQSNLLGESIETILLPGAVQRQPLRQLAIYQQQVFASLSNGSLLHVPLGSVTSGHSMLHNSAQIIGRISGASCIALDWLTPKLYFANEAQQTISRCNLDGSSVETLPLFSTVKELRLDSINAFMYWSTGHAIEVASMNALLKYKYFQISPFSGNSVQGLAIDYNQQKLFFTVKTTEQNILYSGQLLTVDLDVKRTEPLYTVHASLPASFSLTGPIVAYSGKLLWLSHDNKAVITDQQAANPAVISPNQQVFSLALIDRHEQNALDKLSSIPIVTPSSIDKTSIKIDGQPSNFTISWQAVRNVNFGQVRYELILETQEKLFELHLKEPRYQYPSTSTPIDQSIASGPLPVFKIAIRAYTSWAYSRRTVIFPKSSASRGESSANKPLFFEPPRRPNLIKLIKISAGMYELTWTCDPVGHSSTALKSEPNDPSSAIVYAVFRKPVSGDRWSLVYNGTQSRTRIQFPSFELKQSHLVKLIAFNQFGESDPLHYNLNPSLDELIESQQSFDRSLMFVLVAVLATLGVAALIFYYWCKCKFTLHSKK